jgi:hypothetical protein
LDASCTIERQDNPASFRDVGTMVSTPDSVPSSPPHDLASILDHFAELADPN